MRKLGLLGREISHSKSQEVYEKLLGEKITYHLFDYSREEEVPSLEELFKKVDGLSITAPYKKTYLKRKSVMNLNTQLGAINCIRKKEDGSFEATNTDYLAVEKILEGLIEEVGELEVLLLGRGSMAELTQKILDQKGLSYHHFFRDEKNPDLNTRDFSALKLSSKTPLVVNSCSRDFIFSAPIPPETIFWDYNYSLEAHQQSLSSLCDYRDGLGLLELQAAFALKFWGISE